MSVTALDMVDPAQLITLHPVKPEDRPWTRVSATQVEAFMGCPRKWYFGWRQGFKQPETPSMRLGTAIHNELEHFVKSDGEIRATRYAKWVRAAADVLPRPPFQPSLVQAERAISIPTYVDGPTMVGKIDRTDLTGVLPLVDDYKTSKNIRRYAKTVSQLSRNPQLVIYGHECLTFQTPEAPGVRVRHIYLQTEGPTVAHPVEVEMSREHVHTEWAKILVTISEMQAWAEAKPEGGALDLPPNFDHCNDYGGCYHKQRCHDRQDGHATPDFSDWSGGDKTMSDATPPTQPVKIGKLQAKLNAQLAATAPTDGDEPMKVSASATAPTAVSGGNVPAPSLEPEAPALRPTGANVAAAVVDALVEVAKDMGETLPTKVETPAPPKLVAPAGKPGVCARCKGAKYVPAKTLGREGGFFPCPDCTAVGKLPFNSTEPAAEGQVIPPDASSRDLQIGDVGVKDEVYNGPTRTEPRPETTKIGPLAELATAEAPVVEGAQEQQEVAAVADAPAEVKRPRGRPKKTAVPAGQTLEQSLAPVHDQAETDRAARAAAFDAGAPEVKAAEQAAVERVSENVARVAALPTLEDTAAKVESLIAEAAATPEVVASTSVPLVERPVVALPKASNPSDVALTIYQNARPVKGRDAAEVADAEDFVQRVKAQVERELGVSDYRLKMYNEGKGRVVAALRVAMQKGECPAVVTVNAMSDLGQMFLEAAAIFPRANVILGLR